MTGTYIFYTSAITEKRPIL